MNYLRNYKGAVWTNHALDRLGQRGLTQGLAGNTFQRPDTSRKGKEPGTMEYQRRFGQSLVTVIAKQNEKREWLILSCWIDPPLPGSVDIEKREKYHRYLRAPWWQKLLIDLKKQLFG